MPPFVKSWVKLPTPGSPTKIVTFYVIENGQGPQAPIVLRRFSHFRDLQKAMGGSGRPGVPCLPSHFFAATTEHQIKKRASGLQKFLSEASRMEQPLLEQFLKPTSADLAFASRKPAPAPGYSTTPPTSKTGADLPVPRPYDIVFSNKSKWVCVLLAPQKPRSHHTRRLGKAENDPLALRLREALMDNQMKVWQQQTDGEFV